MMHKFQFVNASSVEEAVLISNGDEEAKFLGGGQSFLPIMKQRLASPTKLIRLGGLSRLKGCRLDGGELVIGGGTTHRQVALEAAACFPGLAGLASRIGDPAVRNRGTIGGSLANNDPAACYPSAALACDAVIVTDRRRISSGEFFQGLFTTALEHSEIITAVRFPVPLAAHYEKLVQPASRFAIAGVFVAKFRDCVRIAVTGASEDGVFRWLEGEAALSKHFERASVESLALPSESMITDLFGSNLYRASIIPELAARAVDKINALSRD